ncbi:MAG: choline-sulfatase [Granulosicoccus sp.]
MSKRCNFLILMVDQLTGSFWSDGPADFLHAPNLRALHERSVNFNNAYSPSPLCTPARASFMTGLLPSGTTVYDNAAEFASNLPTFAHYLRRAGYYTALSGKMHFVGADQLHGFEDRLTTDIYPADFGWTPDWRVPYERVDWWYHNLSSVTEAGVAHTSNQLEYDDEVVYHARRTLLDIARRKDDRPFCLTASFTHPHDPYTARPRYWDLYEGVDIPDPKVGPLGEKQRDPHSQRIFNAVDANRFNVTDEHVSNARRAYCANISYLDEKVGELLDTLDECGLGDDTVVVFLSDHGDMLGERGLWYKMNFFEGAGRIPLAISAPDRFSNRNVSMPVTAMDVVPTLLELAGIDQSEVAIALDGQSLVAAAMGQETPDRLIACEYMAEGSVSTMIMLRQGPWKYIFCQADPVQLYNLASDPSELTNLAGMAEHADTLTHFNAILETHWSLDALDEDIRENQQRRILCYEALRRGRFTAWDHQPVQDASERFMRNHMDLNEVEAGNRVPVRPITPPMNHGSN